MALIRTNTTLDGQITGQSPDAGGDDYLVPDHNLDADYEIGKMMEIIKELSQNVTDSFQIIRGGVVSDGGSGTIDITAGYAIGKDVDGNLRSVEIEAKTGVALPSGWNDTRQIWISGQHVYIPTGPTRNHDETSELYNYKMIDSYDGQTTTDDLFVDATPVGNQVVWGSFTMNGTTYADQNVRSKQFSLGNDAMFNPDYLALDSGIDELVATDKFLVFDSSANQVKEVTYDNTIPLAEWRADTHAGYGSTDTKIPYFSNVSFLNDPAIDLEIANNGTNGCRITINTDGIYAVSFNQGSASSGTIAVGISLNSSELTTSIENLVNVPDRIKISRSNAVSAQQSVHSVTAVGKFITSDILRPHTNGAIPSTSTWSNFHIKRIS